MGMPNRLHGKLAALPGDSKFCPHCGREVEKYKLVKKEEGRTEKICPFCLKVVPAKKEKKKP